MATVGIRELKNRLTRYLRLTQDGEEVVITERGRPIALLGPLPADRQPQGIEARLARLAALGRLTLPKRRPLGRIHRVRLTGVPLSQTVLEDRR